MAFILADRIKETTTSTGSPFTLGGAATGFRAFSAVCANGDTAEVCVDDGAGNWIVANCTYATAGNTLTIGTIRSSSNGGAAVTFGSGAKSIYLTSSATSSYNAGSVAITGGNIDGVTIGGTTPPGNITGQNVNANSNMTLGTNTASGYIPFTINGVGGSQRYFQFQTAGSNRWQLGASTGAESGSNAGSDFFVISYTDAGAYLSTPLQIIRATGQVQIGNAQISGGTVNGTTVGQTTAAAGTFTTLKANAWVSNVTVGASATGNASQAGAYAITTTATEFTTVGTTANSAVLPSNPTVGVEYVIWNAGANTLNVYPQAGVSASINALAANAAFTIAAGGSARFTATSSTKWRTG